MKRYRGVRVLMLLLLTVLLQPVVAQPTDPELWKTARDAASVHRFSTLFTAQDVRYLLSSSSDRQGAMDWCKRSGVTRVYLEAYRDGYRADRDRLQSLKQEFRAAGFEVSGCVTPTRVGKPSTGWKEVACCYTDEATQTNLQSIFEFAAGLFDEIMIDDFWFTDCTCAECDAARLAKKITVGANSYAAGGDSWEDYRCELMVRLSRDRILSPAKKVNPKAKLIIKYPQWYDNYHQRGYEVVRETADFDKIWVGTETRDFDDKKWGGTPQYEAYFIMRWLGNLGGTKCGGGWYDFLGTTERTYIEQARQTILGGAKESMLFHYGGLQAGSAARDVEALRTNVPELLEIARRVQSRSIIGIAAYKPPNSHAEKEERVFDFVGMMGLPLVPCHEFPTNAPAAFFSVHALKDPDFARKLTTFIARGKPVLLTDGLAERIKDRVKLDGPGVRILSVKQAPASLLKLDQPQLDELRQSLLKPLKTAFSAPNRVALYLFNDGSWVVENFNDAPAISKLNGKELLVPARGWIYQWHEPQARR